MFYILLKRIIVAIKIIFLILIQKLLLIYVNFITNNYIKTLSFIQIFVPIKNFLFSFFKLYSVIFFTLKRIIFFSLVVWYISLLSILSLLGKSFIINFHVFYLYFDLSIISFFIIIFSIFLSLLNISVNTSFFSTLITLFLLYIGGRISISSFLNHSYLFIDNFVFTILLI